MAAFFANVQVQTNNRLAVVEAVTELLARAGFRPEEETYGGDRSVYVGPETNGWVGVYDSACDGISVGPLAWLAQGLSAELETVTLAWFVYDSALLIYVLFTDGEVADRYISQPDYLGQGQPKVEAKEGRPSPVGGDGERLLEVTGTAGDDLAVSRWLRRPEPFVQHTLRRVAHVLGQHYAELGHAELEADQMAEAHLEDPDRFQRLEFVRTSA